MKKQIILPPYEVKEVLHQLGVDYMDYGIKMVGADKVWEKYTGEGVKVAILDTGIDTKHPDLTQNICKAKSFVPGETVEDKVIGHGTHVAGIIAGARNGIGIIGVAPDVSLYIGKVLCDEGWGAYDWICEGIEWAIAEKVHIISMSLGAMGTIPMRIVDDILKAKEEGIIVIVAAGNWGEMGLSSLAQLETTISVGAVDSNKESPWFSSSGDELDYVAPGVNVYSTYPGNSYALMSGTSMATPYISGMVALLINKYLQDKGKPPTFKQVITELNKFSEDLGVSGFDKVTGNGLVIIEKLLDPAIPDPVVKYWRVQLGAFRSEANAIALRDKLRSQGISAIIKKIDDLYKVQTGAFSNPENAKRMKAQLKTKGYDTWITYY
jgi:major intracellular serine protease